MKSTVVAVALCFALPLSATQVRRMSLEEIRDRAAAIIVVDIVDSSTRAAGAIGWTDYRARVAEVLRGVQHSGDTLTLSFARGADGAHEGGFAGVPRLNRGERYVIFLDDAPGRPVPAIGWGQGIFLINQSQELTSTDGETLAVGARGALVRCRSGAAREHRAADPLIWNADGTAGVRAPARSHASSKNRPADLDDLRRFVALTAQGR